MYIYFYLFLSLQKDVILKQQMAGWIVKVIDFFTTFYNKYSCHLVGRLTCIIFLHNSYKDSCYLSGGFINCFFYHCTMPIQNLLYIAPMQIFLSNQDRFSTITNVWYGYSFKIKHKFRV